jgi:hypothetical protein
VDYGIYFDESNKLDQPNGDYSYYGALGTTLSTVDQMINEIKRINEKLRTKSEMHFVDYTSDTHFEKYFRVLNFVIVQDIKINIMIVNKDDARKISGKMAVTLSELRELFYVKIPERLFYGMTRNLKDGQHVQITIDENSEYEKIELETKLGEQMNAHSAYRNKGYKVDAVKQAPSLENIPLQLIDVFMGIVIFLLECQYKGEENVDESITQMIKSDLIYRFLIHKDNLEKFHKKVTLYKWEGEGEQINEVNLSEYTGEFLIHKTQFDIQEMNRLAKIKLNNPDSGTKLYREEMGYNNRQLRTIQGYLAELNGEGRNSYYFGKD